jgi:signal transduction histidine kinase/ActR/RegA family two-component response regulator
MNQSSETSPPRAPVGEAIVEDPRWPVAWTNRLQRLAASLSGLGDPISAAREAVDQGRAALQADAGVAFVLSVDGGTVEIAHNSGYRHEMIEPWRRFPLSVSMPATDAIRSRETVLLRSREELRRRYPLLAPGPEDLIHDSWAAVPLVVDGSCIGALGLAFVGTRAFEAQEVAFLRVVTDQCTQALHRAQLVERERRSTARLRLLAEASRALAGTSLDVKSVLEAMAAQVLAHVGHSCSIALASPDDEWLEMAALYDRDPERERHLREIAGKVTLRRGEGMSGKVFATGCPLLIPWIAPQEMATRTTPALSKQIEALHPRTVLMVPLKTRGRTLGTIATSRYDEGNPFTPDDQALLEDLADRAALALENARLHEAERQARARAEEADRRKDEFLAMLGHELRNPMASIWMAIELLRRLPADDERHAEIRDIVVRQVAQLSHLVDDLLDVSRINLGKIELRSEPLDLVAIAQQALEASRPLLSERNHQVSVTLPAAPLRVRGDAVRLTQIISNLLNNAAKYTDLSGRVQLRVAAEGAKAVVTVSDSGIGISAEMLGRVFDLFAQDPAARDLSQGGLGVGLTLVKRLVEMHGGQVGVTSPGEGHGSVFTVAFPLLAEGVRVEHAGVRAASAPIAVARRVLIADDNIDAAEGLRLFLELQHHKVEVVHDGPAAVAAVVRSGPEVVLLDISLPGLDGLEVARQVRARPSTARPLLVAITGLGREEDRKRSIAAGFDHHLTKPIDPVSLVALLKTSLDQGAERH